MTAGRAAGSSERDRGGLAHVPALDGLRGLSVAAVLAYHSHWTWARGGFLGVSAFFTLSGFLITTLLLDEHRRAGRIAIGPFLLRRVRRLLPAATTTVVAVVLLGLAGVWDTAQRSAVHSGAPAALLQLANWEMIRSPRSYADLFSAPSPLQHFWSLAIEEQFYWVFPTLLALALVARRPPRRLLAAALATAALASTAAAVVLSSHSDLDRLYLGTDTRMAELFVGASLAALSHRRLRVGGHRGAVLAASVGGASLVGIVIAWTRVDLATLALYRGGLLVHALAVAAVITTAVRRGPVTKLLSVRPLTLLGQLSYSVYLVHWPVFVMVDRYEGRLGTFGTNAVRLGATCALAAVMYRFVETPIRRPAGRGGRVTGPAILGTCGALAGVVSLVVFPSTSGSTDPFSGGIPDPSASLNTPAAAAPVRIMVVGDSVAHGLALAMYRAADERRAVIIDGTSGGCGTLREGSVLIHTVWTEPRAFCTNWEKKLVRYRPDVVVVLRSLADLSDRRLDGSVLSPGVAGHDERWTRQFEADLAELRDSGAATFAAIPPRVDASYGGPARDPARYTRLGELITSAATTQRVEVMNLQTRLDALGITDRLDGVHLSPEGDRRLASDLLPSLIDAGAAQRRRSGATSTTVAPGGRVGLGGAKGVLLVGPAGAAPLAPALEAVDVAVTAAVADCPTVDLGLPDACRPWADGIDEWTRRPGSGTIVLVTSAAPELWPGGSLDAIVGTDTWITSVAGPDTTVLVLPRFESLGAPVTAETRRLDDEFASLATSPGTRPVAVTRPSDVQAWATAVRAELEATR